MIRTRAPVTWPDHLSRPIAPKNRPACHRRSPPSEPRYNAHMRVAKKVTDGPIGVGTSFRQEIMGRCKVIPMTTEFTEFDRPGRMAEVSTWTGGTSTGEVTFEPVNGSTLMRWSLQWASVLSPGLAWGQGGVRGAGAASVEAAIGSGRLPPRRPSRRSLSPVEEAPVARACGR